MVEKHDILGGKVRLYQRNASPVWQCSTYMAGKNHRLSTKEKSLSLAKQFAEDWYFSLIDKDRRGEVLSERTFKDAANTFIEEYETLTDGERNPRWVQDHYRRVRQHLMPFFGNKGLSQVTSGLIQEYRLKRVKEPYNCLLYTSPSPRDRQKSRMPSSA